MERTLASQLIRRLPVGGDSQGCGRPPCAILGGLAFLGRDPAVADENLYRYAFGNPLNLTDPMGLAAAPAGAKVAPPSEQAMQLARLVRDNETIRNFLTEAAKGTTTVERGGFILKSKDVKSKQPYKIVQVKPAKGKVGWDFIELQMYKRNNQGYLPPCDQGGVVDWSSKERKNPDYANVVAFWWHTHLAKMDAEGNMPEAMPDENDRTNDHGVPGLMARYDESNDSLVVYIIDTSGSVFPLAKFDEGAK